jgi:isopentenyl diphosphate isomerase/L-lactate dehydrogenase-like FMN-dependent dehydrogenase
MTVPLKLTPRMMPGALRRPRWMWHYLTSEPLGASAEVDELRKRADASGRPWQDAVFHVNQNWEDLNWLRGIWDGPLLLKGVMCGEDAELALAAGCDGVIVSNHGGRELDATPASIEMLPQVVAAVAGRAPVLLDGGIRRGSDVVKALSLGATACLVARPWLYALACAGEAGVKQLFDQFHSEIIRTLQLVGATSLDQLSTDNLRRRPGSGWEPV